jgi:type IV pilus assembly protein PilN
MLRTNLSTRPFYNMRAVQVTLGAFGVLVIALTLLNAFELIRYGTRQRALGAREVEAQAEATRLRNEAARIRAQINPKELEMVAASAREANAIIDLRAFSWTQLLSQFETTLPEGVRITAIQPRIEKDGRTVIDVAVEARRGADLEMFLDALEMTGSFHDVLTTEEQTNKDGLIVAIVEGAYAQPAREGAAKEGAAKGAAQLARPSGAAGD